MSPESTERRKLNLDYLKAGTGGNGRGNHFFKIIFLHEICNPKDIMNIT